MNKTLLLILCDFLLLTLLSLVNWEKDESEPENLSSGDSEEQSVSTMAMMEQDLLDTLSSSLEEEKRLQDRAETEADKTREELEKANEALQAKDASLVELQSELQAAETREQMLANEKQTLASEKRTLEMESERAKKTITELEEDYLELETQAKQTETQTRLLQQELKSKLNEIAEKEKAIEQERQERRLAEQKAQELSVQVGVAEEQKKMLLASVETLKGEVEAERKERQQLQQQTSQMAEGITQLAERSQDLTEEFRSSQPVNANVIFNRFSENRIVARFRSERIYRGQPSVESSEAMTILVSDGSSVYALSHFDSTPLGLNRESLTYRRVEIELQRKEAKVWPSKFGFLSLDPRVAAIPLSGEETEDLGGRVFYTALDPFKFSEAVLVDEKGDYYGEVEFKLDPATPGYVRMQSKIFNRLFGDFSPTSGDLVFSKTSELLGVMVDKRYCALIDNLLVREELALGRPFPREEYDRVMDSLKFRYESLPGELK
ncbi:MAG TPA: hypothetical protein DIV79_03505 [Opitutae bacterium]|nr:hypothetical protein [Opitutaceae bacterium]HCR29065.1 hypothetical protein [Opitutae bacterium]